MKKKEIKHQIKLLNSKDSTPEQRANAEFKLRKYERQRAFRAGSACAWIALIVSTLILCNQCSDGNCFSRIFGE